MLDTVTDMRTSLRRLTLKIRLWPRGCVVDCVTGNAIRLVRVGTRYVKGTVGLPPSQLLLGEREGTFENRGVARSFDIIVEHLQFQSASVCNHDKINKGCGHE